MLSYKTSQYLKTKNTVLSNALRVTSFRVILTVLLIIQFGSYFSQDSLSQLEAPLNYNAEDSMILNLKYEKAYLYNNAHIDYGEYILNACYIEFDFKTKNVLAKYCLDSLGNKVGIPELSDGSTTTTADSLMFNFETKRGITYHVKLARRRRLYSRKQSQNDKVERRDSHRHRTLYTTCDLDHPHYYFKLRKAIIVPDDKIISGPINLYIADIPTPSRAPVCLYPQQTARFKWNNHAYLWRVYRWAFSWQMEVTTTGSRTTDLATSIHRRHLHKRQLGTQKQYSLCNKIQAHSGTVLD